MHMDKFGQSVKTQAIELDITWMKEKPVCVADRGKFDKRSLLTNADRGSSVFTDLKGVYTNY